MGTEWAVPYMGFPVLYTAALVCVTKAIHHIEFKFHELKDLWRGILVTVFSIGAWVVSYVLHETHEEIMWLQVTTRCVLLVVASFLVVAFFSISFSQPLVSLININKKESFSIKTMGEALGIHDSGILSQDDPTLDIDPNEPLDKLLLNKRFRLSFMEFADRFLSSSNQWRSWGGGSKTYIPKNFYRTGGRKRIYTKTTYLTLLSEMLGGGGSGAPPGPT
ncbi:hypothetical protein HanHA300_Chr08g0263011 [Helianthus annuus]|nr:hypothetical protein HanHA300_Chr08g0263011 [Helianthus annuus]